MEKGDSRERVRGKFTVSTSTFALEVESQQSSVFPSPRGHQRAVCPALHSTETSFGGCKYICILDWPQTSAWIAVVSFLPWVYIFKCLLFCALFWIFDTHFPHSSYSPSAFPRASPFTPHFPMSKVPLAPSSEHSSLCQMHPPYILLRNQRESPPHPLLDRRNLSIRGNSTKPEGQGEEQHEGMNQRSWQLLTCAVSLHAHATLSGQDPRVPRWKQHIIALRLLPGISPFQSAGGNMSWKRVSLADHHSALCLGSG